MSSLFIFSRPLKLIVVVVALTAGCANVASPPGGEVDRKGPTLLRSEPVSGSVTTPISNKVNIFFSERIAEPLDRNAIFVSPRPPLKPQVKWHSDHVEVQFHDSFAVNQTYVVSVSSSITDLRANKLDSAINVAFSTGPSMDSGQVSGYVFQDGKPLAGALVGLYRLPSPATQIPYDSTYPDYIATSNAKGFFSLQYLPSVEFRLLAFVDNNHDERYNPIRELFAAPDRPVRTSGSPIENLRLDLSPFDSAAPKVVSVAYSGDKLLRLRLSRAIPFRDLNLDPGLSFFWQMPDSVNSFRAKALLESGEESGSVLSLYFGGDVPVGLYGLTIAYQHGVRPVVADSVRIDSTTDKTAPTVHRFIPAQSPVSAVDLRIGICFSEPLDTSFLTEQTFQLRTVSDSTIPLATHWNDPLHLDLSPLKIENGMSYKVQVTEFEVIDRAGQPLGDSLRTYNFSTIDPDSLGSIIGEFVFKIRESGASGPVQLTLREVASQNEYRFRFTDRSFKVDLPSGKYLASGFIDADRDGSRTLGSPIPYEFSETKAEFPDTIAVRARFETAGVQFIFK